MRATDRDAAVPPVACFVGPHPDDVEIGAGGTAAKLVAAGWTVHVVIITTHPKFGQIRKKEALCAADALGVARSNVHFLGYPDGRLAKVPGEKLKNSLYRLLQRFDPALVFGPCSDDRHEDHACIYRALAVAARTRGILHYYVLHHIEIAHAPARVGVLVDEQLEQKRRAYRCHRSEHERGSLSEARFQRLVDFGSRIDGRVYELFDVTNPVGYDLANFEKQLARLNQLNFSKFWAAILRLGEPSGQWKLNAVQPTFSESGAPVEGQARQQLKDKLKATFPSLSWTDVVERDLSRVSEVSRLAAAEHCLFSGGPLANPWVHRFVHGHPSFVVRKNQYIRDIHLAAVMPAGMTVSDRYRGQPELRRTGALVIMWGWGRAQRNHPTTIYAAGMGRKGTRAAYDLLLDPPRTLCERVENEIALGSSGLQVNFALTDTTTRPRIRIDRLRTIPAE